ncbi:MAG: hypothetical protein ACE5EU_05065 [Paracoccaceae bacterium]
MRTTDELGRWGGASSDQAADDLSALARARKLFAGLSRSLDGEIDRLRAAMETEDDQKRAKVLAELVRTNQKTLQTVLDFEARLMCEADKQRPGEGVIDLDQARAEIARRLARLAG